MPRRAVPWKTRTGLSLTLGGSVTWGCRRPSNSTAEGRETWITATFAGGKTWRYWGNPEEPIPWDEFDKLAERDEPEDKFDLSPDWNEQEDLGEAAPELDPDGEDKPMSQPPALLACTPVAARELW